MMYINGQGVVPILPAKLLDKTITFKQDNANKYIVSCLSGESIADPLATSTHKWVDSNGNVISFPYTPLADIDLFYQSVSETLLLHCDDYTDSGIYELTLTNNGTTIDTNNKKFGTGSLLCGNNSYISTNSNYFDFGTNDFTIDCWLYPTAYGAIVGCWGAQGYYNFLITTTNGTLTFACSTDWNSMVVKSGGSISLNSWHHIAVTRNGADLYLFINGIKALEYELGSTYSIVTPNMPLTVGADGRGQDGFTGNIDELRILNGTCAWTADFIPPAQPY